tara:strand:+ start:101 stop:1093 length:993 start_codon:yes stop_codon:yes gene_type:complete
VNQSLIITTVPFGEASATPLTLLEGSRADFTINPLGRKLQPSEVADIIGDHDIVIAGTEPITADVMARCRNLKAICRVGIGLDSVDLLTARDRGIAISYTPDAPSPAVAELTLGLMIDAARGICQVDAGMRQGKWARHMGRRLDLCTIGIFGTGRIGTRVVRHVKGAFPNARILASDLLPNDDLNGQVEWSDLETILRECDIVSLHVPLTPETLNLIAAPQIATMKENAILINTARGGIINENALAHALRNGIIAGAAVDVFETEPYTGELTSVPNVILTCHMGSMTRDCRAQMEIEAAQEALRFLNGQPLACPAPEEEYELAKMKRRHS